LVTKSGMHYLQGVMITSANFQISNIKTKEKPDFQGITWNMVTTFGMHDLQGVMITRANFHIYNFKIKENTY
jgi:hypothetical protein